MKEKQLFGLLVISLALCYAAGQINVPLYNNNRYYFLNMTETQDHYKTQSLQILAYYDYSECPERQPNDYKTFHKYQNQLSFAGVNFVFNMDCVINEQNNYGSSRISLPNTQVFQNYQLGLVDTLYSMGAINTKRYFYNVEHIQYSQLQGEIYQIGSFQIGEPDLSLLEEGTQLTNMMNIKNPLNFMENYSIQTNQEFRYEGQAYEMEVNELIIEPEAGDLWSINNKLFFALITLWEEKGIDFVKKSKYQLLYVYFPTIESIEKLSPIDFILPKEDGSEFVFTIDPKDYTIYDKDENMYRLIFYPETYRYTKIHLGKRILQRYYYGFDLSTNKTILAKKKSVQNSQMKQLKNFRRSVILD